MWTLVGAGIKTVEQSTRRMDQVLPKSCVHHKNKVEGFDPDNNTVTLDNGDKVFILDPFIFIIVQHNIIRYLFWFRLHNNDRGGLVMIYLKFIKDFQYNLSLYFDIHMQHLTEHR